jgi:hypothetical protein
MPKLARIAAVALLIAAVPALAQTGPSQQPTNGASAYAPPKSGSIFVYDTTNESLEPGTTEKPQQVVTRITAGTADGDVVAYSIQIGGGVPIEGRTFRSVMTTELAVASGTTRFEADLAPLRALWPPAPGRTAAFATTQTFARRDPASGQLGAFQRIGETRETWSIEKQEAVETPAGRFDTFVFVRAFRSERTGVPAEVRVYRIWYAPALGWYVRFEAVESEPRQRRTTTVLKEMRPG